MTKMDTGVDQRPPDTMYLMFEGWLFLGAFRDIEAAERLQAARKTAGKPEAVIEEYRKVVE